MGDVAELEAEVVYVTKHTVHVRTHVRLLRGKWSDAQDVVEESHTGTFVCLCVNDDAAGPRTGTKRPVGRQLEINGDNDEEGGDSEWRRLYRYLSAQQNHESFLDVDFHSH